MPKYFRNVTSKNDGVFKVQFCNKNLALKRPKWVFKMPKCETNMLKLV